MNLSSPPSISDYTILQTLGVGFNSKVKLAQHKLTKNFYALKFLKTPNKIEKELILNEIKILKNIAHPHLISLLGYNVDESNEKAKRIEFSVLEYAIGGNLFDYIGTLGPFSEDLARTYFQQMLSGLEFLHRKGICHRDLKPENLLLDKDFKLKIADFGFSRLNNTVLNSFIGTPNYMAPEMHLKMPYSGSIVDLFSAGIILFIMISGRAPFNKADPSDRMYKLLCTNKHDIFWKLHQMSEKSDKANFTSSFISLINTMLAFDPTQRVSISEIWAHPFMKGMLLSSDELKIEMTARKKTIEIARNAFENKLNKNRKKPDDLKFYFNKNELKKFRDGEKTETKKKKGKKLAKQFNVNVEENFNIANLIIFRLELDTIYQIFEQILPGNFEEIIIFPKKYKFLCQRLTIDSKISIQLKLYKLSEDQSVAEFQKINGDVLEFYKTLQDMKLALSNKFT